MIRLLRSWFRRRPVTVRTYRVRKTDAWKARIETHARLAREMGRDNPVRG